MFFPFMTDISGKKIVIVGGGKVAFRKFLLFYGFGAKLTVVASEFCKEFEDHTADAELIHGSFDEKYLASAFAVIAATNDRALNESVSVYCSKNRIPVNVVDVPELCTFIVPATMQRGALTVAVSTGGKSPALAGMLKRRFEAELDESWSEKVDILGQIRQCVMETGMPAAERRKLLCGAVNYSVDELKNLLSLLSDK